MIKNKIIKQENVCECLFFIIIIISPKCWVWKKKLVPHKLYTPDEYLAHNILQNYYESQIN